MKNQTVAITTTANTTTAKKLTDVGLETLVWDHCPLTKETEVDRFGEEEQSKVEQFLIPTNSVRTQRKVILDELDELLEDVEGLLLEEENSLKRESECFFSYEQLELKELVEELEISVKEL